jgi:hypothetical protein
MQIFIVELRYDEGRVIRAAGNKETAEAIAQEAKDMLAEELAINSETVAPEIVIYPIPLEGHVSISHMSPS